MRASAEYPALTADNSRALDSVPGSPQIRRDRPMARPPHRPLRLSQERSMRNLIAATALLSVCFLAATAPAVAQRTGRGASAPVAKPAPAPAALWSKVRPAAGGSINCLAANATNIFVGTQSGARF